MNSYYQMETPLVLHADPANPMHAATKQYADSKVQGVDGSRFVSGVIAVGKLPALSGDVGTSVGTNILTLLNSGVGAGVYSSVTVDSKGRVTAGSFTPQNTSNLSWDLVQNKPTTLGGYGIADVVSTVVGDSVASVQMTAVQSTDGAAMVTKGSVDGLVGSVELSSVVTGEVVVRPTQSTPTNFLRSNGAILDKATYAALYAIIGDTYSSTGGMGYMGQPWRQQYAFNTATHPAALTWTTGTPLPALVLQSQAIVTKGRVHLLGGNTGAWSSTVYTAPISADGTLGAWTTGTSLPTGVASSQAIVTKDRVYLLGGRNNYYSSAVYTAPISADGTLGAWTTDTPLPDTVGESQAIVTKDRVYLLGGHTNSGFTSAVYTAPISADGTLGAWTTDTPLPGTVAYSQAVVTKDRVYLLGSASSSTVYTAPISADGTLGAWTTGTPLPTTVHNSHAIVTKDRVYLLGGVINSVLSSTVYTAPINADGTLGAWTTGTSLPGGVQQSQAIVTSSKVYTLGNVAGGGNGVYQADFTGGTNDYVALIANNAINSTTQFKLPDYTSKETNNLFYYIKY